MKFNRLIPEMTVQDIEKSKHFYLNLLGFKLKYERKEDRFVFLSYKDAQIMLEEKHEKGWNVAELVYPFGRGVNFSIEVDDVEALQKRLINNGYPLYRSLMVSQYEAEGKLLEQKEFLVQDPDGYLLRFTQEASVTVLN
ncbi:MAG: VOC family protein [Lachnospiraceae bacterium]|nr:VOC family protein [Lachnospiraceae bacterium]